MKKYITYLIFALYALLGAGCTTGEKSSLSLGGETRLLSFRSGGFDAVIDDKALTATLTVPENFDASSMAVEDVTVSPGAESSIKAGEVLNLNFPQTLTVTCQYTFLDYTITAEHERRPRKFLYAGLSATADALNYEEKAAVSWMLENIPESGYVSFDEIARSQVDLSECEVIWWHLHIDGGIDNKAKFETAAPSAINAVPVLKEYYNAGGNFLLTRFATFYASYLGAAGSNVFPNNCWGGFESAPEIVGGPWNFFIQGHLDHAIYNGLIMAEGEADKVYTFDTGYGVTNSTAQWHIGSDWGGYADYDIWRNSVGATDLGYGGDGAVVVWEYPAERDKGGILCIGSGCYDWYAHGCDISSDRYHGNVATMTQNVFEYLTNN